MGIEPTILGISSYRFSPLSYPVVLRFESDVFCVESVSNLTFSGLAYDIHAHIINLMYTNSYIIQPILIETYETSYVGTHFFLFVLSLFQP